MMAGTVYRGVFCRIGLLVMALPMAGISAADCLNDLRGEVYCGAGRCMIDSEGTVWCSRYRDGDAVITLDGRILCGKGRCLTRSDGRVFCSTESGGAVLKDGRGHIRCYDRCEPAATDNCENRRADSSDG